MPLTPTPSPSEPSADPVESTESGVRIRIYASPKAHKSRIVGLHDGRLKVQLAAPPVDGRANQELIRLLARWAGVPKQRVELVRGASGKRKTVSIEGLTAKQIRSLPPFNGDGS